MLGDMGPCAKWTFAVTMLDLGLDERLVVTECAAAQYCMHGSLQLESS